MINFILTQRSKSNFQKTLGDMNKQLRGNTKKRLVSQCRLFCVEMAAETLPRAGKDGDSPEKGRQKVAERVGLIYKSAGWAVKALNEKQRGIGFRFGELIKRRKFSECEKLLKENLGGGANWAVGTFDNGDLHVKQEGSKSIRSKRVVTNFARVGVYTRKRQKLVGFAKGGFATAARSLGGTRGIPGYATRQKSPGSATISGGDDSPTVTIENRVKYIKHALPKGAEQRVYKRRVSAMNKVMKDTADAAIKKAMAKSQASSS